MDLENNVKLPNPYHCMVTPGFAKGTDDSWGWTVFPARAAVWTNSTEPASCALLHEGGQNPCPDLALNFIFALHMHIKRVKKTGWKQRKEGCSPKNERSCCPLSGQTEGLATCTGNKAKLHPSTCCGCDGNSNSGAKQKNLDCLCLFPLQSRETFLLKRKHLWVLFWGLCLKMCEHFVIVEHKFPRKPLLQNFKIEKPGNTFSTGSCRTGKALLKPFFKQQST